MVDFPASHVNFQGCIAVEPVSQRCHWTSQMCGNSWRFLKKTTRQNPSEPEWTNKSYWWKLPHKAATHNSCKWTKEPQDSLIMFQSHGPSLTFPSPRIYIYTLENTISIDSANSTQVFLSIDFLTQFHDFKLWTGSSGPKIFSCGHLELEWFFWRYKKRDRLMGSEVPKCRKHPVKSGRSYQSHREFENHQQKWNVGSRDATVACVFLMKRLDTEWFSYWPTRVK